MAVALLNIPFLKLIGGVLLLWIGIKLLAPPEEEGGAHGKVQASDKLLAAIKTIIVADLVMSIDEELLRVHKFVVDLYSTKFPELESLVPGRMDYLRTVQAMGNEMDMTVVDLASTPPSALVISVSMWLTGPTWRCTP